MINFLLSLYNLSNHCREVINNITGAQLLGQPPVQRRVRGPHLLTFSLLTSSLLVLYRKLNFKMLHNCPPKTLLSQNFTRNKVRLCPLLLGQGNLM